MRILQDLALVCGVLPLIQWLESYSTDAAAHNDGHGNDRTQLRYCNIPIDFACSLLAELGSELGVVTLRVSPNARGAANPNLREGQTHLVVLLCSVILEFDFVIPMIPLAYVRSASINGCWWRWRGRFTYRGPALSPGG